MQVCPGTEATSAVKDLTYSIRIDTGLEGIGKVGADGKITFRLLAGQVAHVKVMGTTYEVRLLDKLEDLKSVHGVQRRLSLLGYHHGSVDGVVGPRTEVACLGFQADNGSLRVDGLIGPKTRDQLKKSAGG